MKILSIGQFSAYDISNTCLHRNWTLKSLGDVDEIDSTLKHHRFLYRIINYLFVKKHISLYYPSYELNRNIRIQISNNSYDVVWIDKGVFVSANTLRIIKNRSPKTVIIGYSPDNMCERHNQSLHFLKSIIYYDYYITTKSYTVSALKKLGAKSVIFVNNAYEEKFHHPYELSKVEKKKLGGEIGFIGMWEKERCESILFLAKNGMPVRVWGAGKWLQYKGLYPNLRIEERGLFSEDYNKALSAFDISLCFLRKINHDQQTTRTMEIPACKSLLMAERTQEHKNLFEEDKEAVFFSDNDELLRKCKYYIKHSEERLKIAEAGYKRCIHSGYSNRETIKRVFENIGLL